MTKSSLDMDKRSPIAVFLAATAMLTTNTFHTDLSKAAEKDNMGGLKEWTTDQAIDEESKLDEEAQKASKKAKEKDICIPIGEGENCW